MLAFLPTFMQPKHLGSKELPASEIFLVVELAVVAVSLVVPGWRLPFAWDSVRRSPFRAPALLFLVAATVSTVMAVDHAQAFRTYRWVVLEPMIWAVLLLGTHRELRAWTRVYCVLVASAAVVSAIAIGQYISGRDVSRTVGSSVSRAKALYGSPDNLGLMLDRVIPVWFAGQLFGRKEWWPRTAWWFVGLALLLALTLTFSRGAWAAVATAAVGLIATRSWGRWIAVVCLVMGMTGVLYEGPRLADAFRSGHAGTVEQRLRIWRSAARMVRDHPVVGVGPDNFLHYYAPRVQTYIPCPHGLGYMESAAHSEPCLSHPHDVVLDFWLSTGIAGLVAFAWLQVVFWRVCLAAVHRSDGIALVLLAGSMAAMFAGLAHGLVDNSFFLMDLAMMFWLLCAYVSWLTTSGRQATEASG